MPRIAGVDVGGTNIGIAVVDDEKIVDRDKAPTPEGGPEAVADEVARLVGGLGDIDAVGCGIPGPVQDGVVATAPNLDGWGVDVPFRSLLEDRLDRPVAVGNDANVGTLGEWTAGAGRGARCLLGVWMGTGVGGGLVLDGRPYEGAFGGAGEFGHVVAEPLGAVCGCGRRGCVEAYAGRASMEQAARTAHDAGRPTDLLDIMRDKGKSAMTSSVWSKALDRDDPLATELFDVAILAVGAGVASAINLLDLDRVVVGGGLAEKLGQPLADRIAAAAAPNVLVPRDRPVVVAELEDDSGLLGAAALARRRLDGLDVR